MNSGLMAIIITLVIIVAAVKTKRCVECMLAGSFIAAFFIYKGEFLYRWCDTLQMELANNVWVFLVCLLFGALISLLTASRGSFGFSKYLSKYCNSERKTLLTTFIMGILIFVDDYLNVLSIGASMKEIYDKRKMPRESLAFMLDSTGAPVCVLLPISTWAVFYANLFFNQQSVKDLGFTSALQAYAKAIPYCFYPWITLIVVFSFCMGWIPKIGPMKKAFTRAKETGKVYSDLSKKYNHDTILGQRDEGKIRFFTIPMGILIFSAVLFEDILVAVTISLFTCFILYTVIYKIMDLDDFMANTIKGFGDMLQMLTMLLVTFVLKEICAEMGMTEYIIGIAEPYLIKSIFPACVFMLGALLAFTTGSDWGMSSIITPIVFPLGAIMGVNPILIMAAVISGGAFGSHACFYADATLLASQSAGIDSTEHAVSQLPYVLIACVLSIVCFVIVG